MKKRTGGRVTPKGTQPAAQSKGKGKGSQGGSAVPRALPGRVDPTSNRGASGPVGPTRAGPRGGNR